ncbi:MAG: XRE family transcriptional regulator [Myxococcota bacterium]|nr:XRE family transcriptional regulator [Myxococcota bacterium]
MTDEKPATLGKRIQRHRKNKNITLQHLANETGHATPYLEQLERDEIIPPVAVLLKLSRALEVNSGEFLKAEAETLEKRAEAIHRRTDRYAYKVLTPDSLHKHLKGFLVTIDPTSDLDGASYQHEGEELMYVLSGDVTVSVGETQHALKQGDCLHFNSGLLHKLTNRGDVSCELLVVLYTP